MLVSNCTKSSLIPLKKLNFPDYAVTENGEVYSFKKGNKVLLKSSPDTQGYNLVRLFRNGNAKTFYVHRLVAQFFLPNPENKKYVRHLSNNRTDNRAVNLVWANAIELNSDKIKITPELEKQICILYFDIGCTQYEIADMINVSQTTICNVLRRIEIPSHALSKTKLRIRNRRRS